VDTCFYCHALLSVNDVEHDHFPIPQESGGTLTVPSCRTCHNMKDRFNLADWPQEWIDAVLADLPYVSRETRLFLAKALRLFVSCQSDNKGR
jgi:hypothetical protein